MDQNGKKDTDMTSFFNAWMKSTTDFWGEMLKMQPPGAAASSKTAEKDQKKNQKKRQKGSFYQSRKAWESGNKMFLTLVSMLSQPENMESMLKGSETIPEFFMDMANQGWDGYFEIQKKLVERAAKMGQHTEAYDFEDMDPEIFRKFKEVYEKEIQKYLNVPQVGLTRFYQERANRVVDKFNLFQTSLGEFMYMFYVPLEKSFAVLQEKIEHLTEEGDIRENFKDYYNMWVKLLEGHYMTLLQSPEYIESMNNTINSLMDYREAKNDMWYDMLQNVPIPTNKDMDEFYKEFYLLKKKVRELSKKLEKDLTFES